MYRFIYVSIYLSIWRKTDTTTRKVTMANAEEAPSRRDQSKWHHKILVIQKLSNFMYHMCPQI